MNYMPNSIEGNYLCSTEAARLLGVKPVTVSQLCQRGQLPAEKFANRWVIDRQVLEEFAKTYNPNRGRPKTKRKYTKRSPIWQAN